MVSREPIRVILCWVGLTDEEGIADSYSYPGTSMYEGLERAEVRREPTREALPSWDEQ